jgi:hypothetical protein
MGRRKKLPDLGDYLIQESDRSATKEIIISVTNPKTGNDEELKFGIRDPKGVTWGEKKKLVNAFFNKNIESRNGNVGSVDFVEGDMLRYTEYIKWIESNGRRKELTKSEILALPQEIIDQLDEHIPTFLDSLGNLEKSLKKKLGK